MPISERTSRAEHLQNRELLICKLMTLYNSIGMLICYKIVNVIEQNIH
jgi:hypothetical protein